jgi:hypothetical protein
MLRDGLIDVIGVSSTAEVEGLGLLCQEYNLEWETLTMIPTTTITTATTRSRTSTHPDGTIQVVLMAQSLHLVHRPWVCQFMPFPKIHPLLPEW